MLNINSKPINKLGDIQGMLQLTINGTFYFQTLSDLEKKNFSNTLIEELTLMIPAEKGRLESNEYHQLNRSYQTNVFYTDDCHQSSQLYEDYKFRTLPRILIPLFISKAKVGEKLTATEIKDFLHRLIGNKVYTGISTGNATKFLDRAYGFQTQTYQETKESDQKVKEESDLEVKEHSLIFIASWLNGIRTIKSVSGNYTQSRTISYVDLMKLHCSQTSVSDVVS
ncbi:10074_t:CDS:2 [Dentiscutata erythropus]|uniref:10074_t:CDS:1 n=1 Tax=Dentiscutata erythropus TaxID=1348616 RepID=A0A9N9FMF2_9GLOM|nr:10074_t:CDS:2 [Dentiscutata erythropus]